MRYLSIFVGGICSFEYLAFVNKLNFKVVGIRSLGRFWCFVFKVWFFDNYWDVKGCVWFFWFWGMFNIRERGIKLKYILRVYLDGGFY